jgi:hypothetical protein
LVSGYLLIIERRNKMKETKAISKESGIFNQNPDHPVFSNS